MNEAIKQSEKPEVPVVCATRDFQGAVAETIVTLWNSLWSLGKSPVYVQFQSHGYAFVRAGVFANMKQEFKTDVVRGFMIDDDVVLKATSQQLLMAAITTADQYHWNFVSPYRTRDGYVAVSKENGDLMTVEEVRSFAHFDRIPNAGLGFYYGDLPLNYRFHEDGVFGGEDLNFFYDNPQLEPRIFDLGLQHLKVCPLDLNTPIHYRPRPLVGKPPEKKTAEELGIRSGEQPRIKE